MDIDPAVRRAVQTLQRKRRLEAEDPDEVRAKKRMWKASWRRCQKEAAAAEMRDRMEMAVLQQRINDLYDSVG